ncbi:MAG: hypothetical protein Tsb009_36470 [Planctomycetaceae bacterium]
MAETPGSVVECPHCHSHLKIPEEQNASATLENDSQSTFPSDNPLGISPDEKPVAHDEFPGIQTDVSEPSSNDADTLPSAFPVLDENAPANSQAENLESFPDVTAGEKSSSAAFPPSTESDDSSDSQNENSTSPVTSDSDVVSPADLSDSFSGQMSDAVHVGLTSTGKPGEEQTQTTGEQPLDDSPQPTDSSSSESMFAGLSEPLVADGQSVLPAFDQQNSAEPSTTVEQREVAADSRQEFSPAEHQTALPLSTDTTGKPAKSSGVSRLLILLLISYASAVTIGILFLGLKVLRTHPLENLPDVVPVIKEDGTVLFQLYPEDVTMPRGHTLKLGETRRFGSLEITPVKVTRGPAIIVTSFGNQTIEDPTEDVLKLWLRIKNVSSAQTFPPLGRKLVRTRSVRDHRANQFVCQVNQKKKEGERVLLYALDVDDEQIALKDQQLNRPLKPGEEYETYLATTDEGLEKLTGELVWRVHFRKGYHPETRHGVTTLIEVQFDSQDIQIENAEI